MTVLATASSTQLTSSAETRLQKFRTLLTSEEALTQWSPIDRLILGSITDTDSTENYNQNFAITITNVCQQLGCKLPIGPASAPELPFTILRDFHNKYFRIYNLADVRMAFEMHILGELKNSKGEKYQHYQNFDCDFYSNIMSEYKKRRDRVIVSASAEVTRFIEVRSSEEENQRAHLNILNRIAEDFHIEYVVPYTIKYKVCVEEGLISLTPEQEKEYLTKARAVEEESLRARALTGGADALRKLRSGIIGPDEQQATIMRLAYLDFISDPANESKVLRLINGN